MACLFVVGMMYYFGRGCARETAFRSRESCAVGSRRCRLRRHRQESVDHGAALVGGGDGRCPCVPDLCTCGAAWRGTFGTVARWFGCSGGTSQLRYLNARLSRGGA